MKHCTHCHETKPSTNFYMTARGAIKARCIKCDLKYQSERRARIRSEKETARARAYAANREDSRRMKLQKAKAEEGSVKCQCCTGRIVKEEMYDENYCTYCHDNRKDYDKYWGGKRVKW